MDIHTRLKSSKTSMAKNGGRTAGTQRRKNTVLINLFHIVLINLLHQCQHQIQSNLMPTKLRPVLKHSKRIYKKSHKKINPTRITFLQKHEKVEHKVLLSNVRKLQILSPNANQIVVVYFKKAADLIVTRPYMLGAHYEQAHL